MTPIWLAMSHKGTNTNLTGYVSDTNLIGIFNINGVTSENSGCIVVECTPASWNISLIWLATAIYSWTSWHRIWAEAMILSPASCHKWNSWTAWTPFNWNWQRSTQFQISKKKLCKFAIIILCKFAIIILCKFAIIILCKFAIIILCKFAIIILCKFAIIILFIGWNMCFGCSKELSKCVYLKKKILNQIICCGYSKELSQYVVDTQKNHLVEMVLWIPTAYVLVEKKEK